MFVGFLFRFCFVLFFFLGGFLSYGSCFFFSFSFWGISLIYPNFKLFFVFRVGKGPLTEFTDDGVEANFVIVDQMLQKLFPLCRQRYCKPTQSNFTIDLYGQSHI